MRRRGWTPAARRINGRRLERNRKFVELHRWRELLADIKAMGWLSRSRPLGLVAGAAIPRGQVQDYGFLFLVVDPGALLPRNPFPAPGAKHRSLGRGRRLRVIKGPNFSTQRRIVTDR